MEEAKLALIELQKSEVQVLRDSLQQDIEEERKLRELERQRNNALELVQIEHGRIIKDLDDKIRIK